MALASMRQGSTRSSASGDVDMLPQRIQVMSVDELRALWRRRRGQAPPEGLSKDLIARALAYWVQEARDGGLDPLVRKRLAALMKGGQAARHLRVGTVIVREYRGRLHEVTVTPAGFLWDGQIYASLSAIAKTITGTAWNGHRFFGLRGETAKETKTAKETEPGKARMPDHVAVGGTVVETVDGVSTSVERIGR